MQLHLLTWLSIPSKISMKKKAKANTGDPGMVLKASGYMIKTNPGPVNNIF